MYRGKWLRLSGVNGSVVRLDRVQRRSKGTRKKKVQDAHPLSEEARSGHVLGLLLRTGYDTKYPKDARGKSPTGSHARASPITHKPALALTRHTPKEGKKEEARGGGGGGGAGTRNDKRLTYIYLVQAHQKVPHARLDPSEPQPMIRRVPGCNVHLAQQKTRAQMNQPASNSR